MDRRNALQSISLLVAGAAGLAGAIQQRKCQEGGASPRRPDGGTRQDPSPDHPITGAGRGLGAYPEV